MGQEAVSILLSSKVRYRHTKNLFRNDTLKFGLTSSCPLLQTCRVLYSMMKRFIYARAQFYFQTPDAIQSFIDEQKQAPMVARRAMHLDTVVLDIRRNANWPLQTTFKIITTPMPTNPDEWEAKIQMEAPERPFKNVAKRYLCRNNTEMMRNEWSGAVFDLLSEFAIKNLVVRGNRGFQRALFWNGGFIKTFLWPEFDECVETAVEVGQWPEASKGDLEVEWNHAGAGRAKAANPSF